MADCCRVFRRADVRAPGGNVDLLWLRMEAVGLGGLEAGDPWRVGPVSGGILRLGWLGVGRGGRKDDLDSARCLTSAPPTRLKLRVFRAGAVLVSDTDVLASFWMDSSLVTRGRSWWVRRGRIVGLLSSLGCPEHVGRLAGSVAPVSFGSGGGSALVRLCGCLRRRRGGSALGANGWVGCERC